MLRRPHPVRRSVDRRRLATLLSVVAAVVAPAACGGASNGVEAATATTVVAAAPCPSAPLPIVVTVDQWHDLVATLAGGCGEVTTIVAGTSGDPHDYELSPADAASFGEARLVVQNGAGYDPWAADAVEASGAMPMVVDAGVVAGAPEGGNPHLWYSPEVVDSVAAAVTSALRELAPGAAGYFAERAAVWVTESTPYRQAVEQARKDVAGHPYAATEPVIDLLGADLGLLDRTPSGYREATQAESEPGPGDVHRMEEVIRDHQVEVLVVNTQTSGALSEQLTALARESDVPVVEVTETIPPGDGGFVAWQVRQLRELVEAVG